MILEIGEAYQTWCPMTRMEKATSRGFVNGGQVVFNRVEIEGDSKPGLPSASFCVADRCAMWRWLPSEDLDGSEARGYCGLAGLPLVAGGGA